MGKAYVQIMGTAYLAWNTYQLWEERTIRANYGNSVLIIEHVSIMGRAY
jgi:threonine/homoserine/homoserine lactone efflux protein